MKSVKINISSSYLKRILRRFWVNLSIANTYDAIHATRAYSILNFCWTRSILLRLIKCGNVLHALVYRRPIYVSFAEPHLTNP